MSPFTASSLSRRRSK